MSITAPRSDATHEVFNQVPPLENRNLFLDNAPLVEALEREGGGWAHDRAVEAGTCWGGEAQEWCRLANENPPVLRTHDRVGNRLDAVDFHPAWHQLMEAGKRFDMGKCCLRFKHLDDLELTSVAKMIAMSTPKDYIAYYKRTKGLTMRATAS